MVANPLPTPSATVRGLEHTSGHSSHSNVAELCDAGHQSASAQLPGTEILTWCGGKVNRLHLAYKIAGISFGIASDGDVRLTLDPESRDFAVIRNFHSEISTLIFASPMWINLPRLDAPAAFSFWRPVVSLRRTSRKLRRISPEFSTSLSWRGPVQIGVVRPQFRNRPSAAFAPIFSGRSVRFIRWSIRSTKC